MHCILIVVYLLVVVYFGISLYSCTMWAAYMMSLVWHADPFVYIAENIGLGSVY